MHNDNLTLAGNLIFGIEPQRFSQTMPFYIDCCYFDGNDISVNKYKTEERIYGDFETLYKKSFNFLTSNLRKIQVEENFNSNGVIEINETVLGELITNALVHRDYYINSPIRIFMFNDRVEIISPGKLTNSLTIENIIVGSTIRRNPILEGICKHILSYSGYGSGIKRVLEINPNVEFINDKEKEEFKCIIPRNYKILN
ncbi:MAG: ATP-binding protein [Candidatus Gracilibacteria bacterium]|nr:ATP-binding protein [Candidatus Gracilibacteria bacterium]